MIDNHYLKSDNNNEPDEGKNLDTAQKAATSRVAVTPLMLKSRSIQHSSSEMEICDLSLEDCVRTIIKEHPVVLFSLSWCPECKQSMELLKNIGVSKAKIHIIDLDDYEDIELDIRANMKAISGRRSVPNLFVGGEFAGGYEQTKYLHNRGDLVRMFQMAGVLPHKSDQLCDLSSVDCVRSIVKEHPVVLFSLSFCPPCHQMKEILNLAGVPVDKMYIIDLDDYGEIDADIRFNLMTITGRRDTPGLFVGGEYVGGIHQTRSLQQSQKLVPMLQKAGALAH